MSARLPRCVGVFAALLLLMPGARPCAAAVPDATRFRDRPDDWFKTGEGRRIVDNILTWQNPNGGWWKAYDPANPRPPKDAPPDPKDPSARGDTMDVWHRSSTFDNDATTTELRILARAFRVTADPRCGDAFQRGMKFIFDSQYPNGGWPQRFPLQDNYGRHITFNDNAMINVMNVLRDVADARPDFAFVDAAERARSRDAFDRGVRCILDCQIKVRGKLTVWCQQHDEVTLAPVGARAYELPGLTGNESADIVLLLMSLDNPDARVRPSIRAAVAWFEASKITGKRTEKIPDPTRPGKSDVVVVDDPTATEPLWARFYDIETNRPFFCGRDGIKKWSLAEIEPERRAGYAWMRGWGKRVLTQYPKWAAKNGEPTTIPTTAEAAAVTTSTALAADADAPATATAPAAAAQKAITVRPDGSGDQKTVQAAVDAVPDNNTERVVIDIAPAAYKERIRVPKDKPFITFKGSDAKTTILTYDWNASHVENGRPIGTSNSYSTRVDGHDFVAEKITFENTAGDTGQAVAMFAHADRVAFRDCRFIGWQDTLYTNAGRQYYVNCYIEGRTDFIFGDATAVFDHCVIHSKNGGYVTAASTPKDQPFGYVFLDCKLSGEGAPALLGRPWRDYGATAFIRCELGGHIKPEGWDHWKPEREQTARYSEYKCTGPGADRTKRVTWSKELSDEEAGKYTISNILSGADHWDPTK